MLAELAQLRHPLTRWQFALSCMQAALFAPRKRRPLPVMLNSKMTSRFITLRSPFIIGFLIVLPFMLLDFFFDIARRLETFSSRNALDFIVVFGFLWLSVSAIILILA